MKFVDQPFLHLALLHQCCCITQNKIHQKKKKEEEKCINHNTWLKKITLTRTKCIVGKMISNPPLCLKNENKLRSKLSDSAYECSNIN